MRDIDIVKYGQIYRKKGDNCKNVSLLLNIRWINAQCPCRIDARPFNWCSYDKIRALCLTYNIRVSCLGVAYNIRVLCLSCQHKCIMHNEQHTCIMPKVQHRCIIPGVQHMCTVHDARNGVRVFMWVRQFRRKTKSLFFWKIQFPEYGKIPGFVNSTLYSLYSWANKTLLYYIHKILFLKIITITNY